VAQEAQGLGDGVEKLRAIVGMFHFDTEGDNARALRMLEGRETG